MPSMARLSPRAAIETWLARPKNSADSVENRSRSYQPHQQGDALDSYSIASKDRLRLDQQEKKSRGRLTALEIEQRENSANNVGLAERLGLHAPFRTFPDHNGTYEHLDQRVSRRNRKRRCEASSSSILEPAEVSLDREQSHRKPRQKEERMRLDGQDRSYKSGSGMSESGPDAATSPEGPTKQYGRRPRHKTKDDKYEVKQPGRKSEKHKGKKEKRDAKAKQGKKRKRKERSGDALMHTFSAPNVAQDRLTIRPSATTGLFGKGRASSPVRRRGLPDLTFSEVAFLNPRTSKQDNAEQRAPEKKRRRRDRAIDAEDEMSRFFTAQNTAPREGIARAEPNRTTTPTTRPAVKDHLNNVTEPRAAPLKPPVELPDQPFLGFGSSGVSLTSPIKLVVGHHDMRRRASPCKRRLLERSSFDSSSYYTWSESRSSKVNHLEVDATPIQLERGAQKPPKAQPPGLTHSPSGSDESVESKTLRVAGTDPELRRKRSETKILTPGAALPNGTNLAIETQADKASHNTPTSRRDSTPPAKVPEGTLHNKNGSNDVDKEQQNPCEIDIPYQKQSPRSEEESRSRNDFPLRFDEALESLLGACKVPSQKHNNAAGTPRVRDDAKRLHRLQKLINSNAQSRDAGNFDQSHALTPSSLMPHEELLDRGPDLKSPRSIFRNNITFTPTSLPTKCAAEDSATVSQSRNGHETRTQVFNRPNLASSSDVRMPWLRNEQFNESQGPLISEPWRGYQSIYQGQVLPEDEANGYNSYASNPGEFGGHGGKTRSPQPNSLAELSELRGPHNLDRGNLAYIQGDPEDNMDSYDVDTCGSGPGSTPFYNASYQYELLDYDKPAADLGENIYTPISAFAGVEQMATKNDNLHFREYRQWPNLVIPSRQDEYSNSPDNGQHREYNDPSKEHLAGFWRPNKLY